MSHDSNTGDGTGLSRRDALKAVGGAVAAGAIVGKGAASDIVEVNVGFEGLRGRAEVERAAASVKREFNFEAMTIRASPEAIGGLENNPNIRYVEENGTMHALDQTTPYGIDITDADVAIGDGNTGDGVSIAILDTGIDAQHETLEENLGEGWATDDAACTTDCGGGGPFGGGGNDIDECLAEWDDDNDHGSHCAGTAAAADNGEGVLGVAPDATLHAVKVLQCDGGGTFDDIAAGIEWSADQGHEVQSMSLGADSSSDVVEDAIEYAAERNVVMVAAAGNDGPCSDCVGFPARHPEVIAVSATDENDELADFSSTGPEVELAAPGVDTLSTIPRDDYDEFSGTSMACPHVSGAAATVIADGTTDREAVRAELKEAADDIGLDDNEQGAGRLNVADAVDADEEEEDDEEEEESVAVSTDGATDVGETSATLNGDVTELDGADEADVGFEYGESGGDLSSTVDAGTVSATDSFDADVDGLVEDTEYEFRAVAETSEDSDTGSVLAFTTDAEEDEEEEDDEEESTAPVIDQFDLTDNSNPQWARVEVDWAVSGDELAEVTSVLNGGVDSETSAVSGDSATGTHELRERGGHGEAEVTLTVTDADGNETSETQTIDLN